MLHRLIPATALLCLVTTACGPAREVAAPPAEVAETVQSDPVPAALSGAAQRSLERRHPDARVILADQTVNRGIDQAWVCGRYILLTHNTRRERYFIVSTTELVELGKTADRRWSETCADAKPLQGSLDTIGAETQAALLTRR